MMKLEYTIKEGIFLTPKVYMLITDADEYVHKFKGVNLKSSNLQQL